MIDIRDVKPPVAFPANYVVLFLLFILLLVGGMVAIGYFLRKKFLHRYWFMSFVGPSEPVDLRLPWQIACEQLELLQKTSLLAEGNFREYYSRLSDIVRQYFENQFQIRAPEMTTEEFLLHLKDSQGLTVPQQNALRDFLDACDMVKFAKHAPMQEEARKNVGVAKRLIDETRQNSDITAGRQDGI